MLLHRIEQLLARVPGQRSPRDGEPPRAAVALIFRPADDPDVLLIRRAERAGDPWSGQIALPGGRWSAGDASLEATAIRETREEIGLDLALRGTVLGALDELRPRTPHLPPIIVRPYVAVLSPPYDLTLNHEVAEAFWVPWSELAHPQATRDSVLTVRGTVRTVPSLVVGGQVIWGLTERIIRQLLLGLASGA